MISSPSSPPTTTSSSPHHGMILFISDIPLASTSRRSSHALTSPLRRPRPQSRFGSTSSSPSIDITTTTAPHRRPPRCIFLPSDPSPLDEPGGRERDDSLDFDEYTTVPSSSPSSAPSSPPRDYTLGEDDIPSATSYYRSGYVGADELNERLRFGHLARHRHTLAPEEAFGAIFTWDVVMTNGRELEQATWELLAKERGYSIPDMDDIIRAETMPPESAITRVFLWSDDGEGLTNSGEMLDWGEIKRIVYRKHELHRRLEGTFEWKLRAGIEPFLNSMVQYGVKCILCAYSKPKDDVLQILESLGLKEVFSRNSIISMDDDDGGDIESPHHLFLSAALRCERPPEKCIVFTDRPTDITIGHDITAKVIAVINPYPAYEMKTADHVIADYEDLVVYNMRRLFSEQGSFSPYELEPEMETEVS